MSIIRCIASRLKRSLVPVASLKRQTFVVRYQVMVKNSADKSNECLIVVPVPQTIGAQRIASEPRFTPAVTQLGVEERFGNRFATWKVKLAPGESRLFTEHFTVSVDPVKKEIPSGIAITEYKDQVVSATPSAHLETDNAQLIALAKEAAAGAADVKTLVAQVNEFVIKRLEYGNPIKGLYGALEALRQVKVDCGGYDSLFVSLCLINKIPARIVSGFWAGYVQNDMHAWAEIQLPDGQWIPVDPSFESLSRAGRSHKLGGLGVTGSDRIIFSVGCDMALPGFQKAKQVDILQHPFVEAGMGDGSLRVETRVETTKA